MEYVKSNCSVISLRAFEKYLQGNISLQSDSIVITFDDGYKSFYDIAYPILKQYQLPATCFLVTTKVNGNDDLFMHWDEVKEITRHGLITIGSHTISHKSLSAVDDLQLENEIRESKILIENNLKIPIHYFSYPYGTPRDIDERCFQALANSGYKLSCTSINGVNSRNTTRLRLRRTKIEWGDGLNTFKKILHGALDIWVVIDYVSGFLLRKRESTERGQEFLGV
jgi:peptidoglycan/xylan/chitin deacetylase (PgdA/CDA1 family)